MVKVMVDLDTETDRKVRILQVELEEAGLELKKPEVIAKMLKHVERKEIRERIKGGDDD